MDHNTIIKDWIDFCEGRKDLDIFHFYTLFHEGRSIEEIKKIFSYFDQADKLELNIASLFSPLTPTVYFSEYPLAVNKLEEIVLSNLVKKDIHEKREFCQRLGKSNLVSAIDAINTFEVVPKQNLKDLPDDILHYQINEFLGDYFMDQRVPDTKKVRALFEAFYGLVNNKSLVWFLGSPLIKTDFNFTYYMQLWKGGGDYRIENNSVLVGL